VSYLDAPRLHFAGKFFADPSTINNATENYNLSEVYNNNPPSDTNPNSVWWNKLGQHFFKFLPGCTVQSARDKSGQLLPSGSDSIVGAELVSVITGTPNPQWARLVDLDPDQQSRSMIVGLALQLTISGEPGVSLTGTVRPLCILDLWGRVQAGGGGQGIASAGCAYQSVMENLVWNGISGTKSAFLKQLYAASPDKLSIKFNVDGYNGNIIDTQNFAQGRLVGTIGPYLANEPAHFLAQRRVFSGAEAVPSQQSPLNAAPFKLKGTRLSIDLGNATPTTKINGGPFADLGPFSLVIDPLGGNTVVSPPLFTTGTEYGKQYTQSAGIYDVELSASEVSALSGKPLAIQITPPAAVKGAITGMPAVRLKEGLTVAQSGAQPSPGTTKSTIALAEFNSGYFADVDLNALRLEKGAPVWDANAESGTAITANAQILLVATQWGKPAANLPIAITVAQNQYQFRNSQGNFYNINNDPMTAVTYGASVTTDGSGRALLQFAAGSLNVSQKPERRQDVDGQLYLFTHPYTMDSLQPITLLVFDDSPTVTNPTWWQDVEPVFRQYARLYPSMRDLIDLSDYASVTNQAFGIPQKIQMALSLPMEHPAFMPVSRDMSLRIRNMVLTWFKNNMPEGTKP
jgi:hypothetical protein